MSCFFDAGLNLMECGDRIGKKYKKSNISQLIIGFLIMTAVFFVNWNKYKKSIDFNNQNRYNIFIRWRLQHLNLLSNII